MSPVTWVRSLGLSALVIVVGFVGPALTQAPKPKKFALLVGVTKYDHADLSELKYAENDAEKLAEVLKAAGYDEVVILSHSRGKGDKKLIPTAANVRAQLKTLSGKVKRDDLLLVGLSGHGVRLAVMDEKSEKEQDESFFCPADARPRNGQPMGRLRETMIPLGELFKELDASGAGVRLLLVDACRNDVSDSRGRNLDVDNLPRTKKGTAALFSCKGGEQAFETDKLKHGVFFHHVIEGLKGKAKDDRGQVTWGRLAEYVVEKVSAEVPTLVGGGAKQTPHEMKNIEGLSPVLLGVGEDAGRDKGKKDKPGSEVLPGTAKKDKDNGNQGTNGIVEYKQGKQVQRVKARLVEVVKSTRKFDANDKVVGYELTLRYVGGDEIPGTHTIGAAEIAWDGIKGGKGRLNPAQFKPGTKLAVVIDIKKGVGGGGNDQVVIRQIFSDKSFKPEK